MQPEEATFNRRTVGRAGIAWAIVQFFSIPLSIYYPVTYLLTPPVLIVIAGYKLSTIFSFLPMSTGIVFLGSALVLLLLTIGLTIGAYRNNFVCAVLLFINVAVYLIIAVYGLLFGETLGNDYTIGFGFSAFSYTVIAIYIGIMLIILLFMASGIWGKSLRTPKSPINGGGERK